MKTSIDIQDQVWEALKFEAIRQRRPLTEIVDEVLVAYLKKKEALIDIPPPRVDRRRREHRKDRKAKKGGKS